MSKRNPQTTVVTPTSDSSKTITTVSSEISRKIVYELVINPNSADTTYKVTLSGGGNAFTMYLPPNSESFILGGNPQEDEIVHFNSGDTISVGVDTDQVDVVVGTVDE